MGTSFKVFVMMVWVKGWRDVVRSKICFKVKMGLSWQLLRCNTSGI